MNKFHWGLAGSGLLLSLGVWFIYNSSLIENSVLKDTIKVSNKLTYQKLMPVKLLILLVDLK